ncbi:CAMK family protein kinase [Tritrichomonas foetus]|uniref:CAMK family protein kinase n=1 Tax=Tritrichomonas foetus TaxID=1144522 RepID=A0A1J4L1R5_9EUKA|nr:CAMK family protein kinase [Tritrichomonas foetus]|eukprot:OHT17379.1 CAMK family protein kinase [Tritrichomonas foetus]
MSCEINETLWKHGYELTNQIGKGGFASVYSILSTKYQETYVAKTIQNDTSKRNGNSNSFLSEIEALKSIVHPNIVSIYNHFTDSSFFYIILEFCPGGNLGEFIRKHGVLTRNDFFNYSRQILNALHYMHLRKMAHRDIKPANIFLDAYGRVKLGDFGLAITSNELCKTFSGSQAFQAPEIVKKLPFCPMKADIWAFGVTMYYLAIGDLEFSEQKCTESD